MRLICCQGQPKFSAFSSRLFPDTGCFEVQVSCNLSSFTDILKLSWVNLQKKAVDLLKINLNELDDKYLMKFINCSLCLFDRFDFLFTAHQLLTLVNK